MTAASRARRSALPEHGPRCSSLDAATETMTGELAGDPVGDPVGDAAARGAAGAAPSGQPLALPPLCTPAEAARVLAVPESWLRRQVTARLVPHTRLGKHLRFSHADLVLIAAAAAHPAAAAVAARRPLRSRRPRTTNARGW